MNLCPTCGDLFSRYEPDDVACDGCHKVFHRECLKYRLIDVEWDDTPKAYAFCRNCDE